MARCFVALNLIYQGLYSQPIVKSQLLQPLFRGLTAASSFTLVYLNCCKAPRHLHAAIHLIHHAFHMASINRMHGMRHIRQQLATHNLFSAHATPRSFVIPAIRATKCLSDEPQRKSPITSRTSFHTSARKAILPPLPRKFSHKLNRRILTLFRAH
jgi:hypothetical protein